MFRDAVVECLWRRAEILHAEVVFPRVDSNEDAARQPSEDDKDICNVCGWACEAAVAIAGAERYAHKNRD